MTNGHKISSRLLAAAIGFALGIDAHAATPPPADNRGAGALEEVVVTAQRRETSVQQTPMAVTAYGADELAAKNIRTFGDLGVSNAALNVSLFQGEAQVYLRGIGVPMIIGGTDSSIAIHNDGVFLSRAAASVPAFFDVERVEVIRGPQGTLYGRNATGGSINVISRGPSREFEGEARLTVGNYQHYQPFVALGGPLSDRVRFRVAAQLNDREGYTKITRPVVGGPPGTVDRVEDAHEFYTRLKLEADLTDKLTFLLTTDYYRADDSAVTWHVFDRGYSQGAFTTNGPFTQAVDAAGLSPLASRDMSSDIEFYNKPKVWGASGRFDLKLGEWNLMSLTAYRRTNPLNRDDLDFSTANASDQVREEKHRQVSQEFQLSSPSGRALEYILGAYYFDETNTIRNEYFLATVPTLLAFAPAPDCCLLLLNGTAETTAYAAFVDGSYEFTDRWSLRFGARYSREERDGTNFVQLDRVPAFDNIAEFDAKTFTAFTPKIGVEFRPSDGTMLYASAVRGFKSGGFNIGSYQNSPFDPEFIWSYELGLKTDLFDRRLRLNAAAFYYDYTDLQVQDTERNNVLIRNAASASVKGVELEGAASPLESGRLTIDFAFAWLDATFKDYLAADPKYNNYAAALGVSNPNAGACPTGTPDAALPNNPTCPFTQDLSGSRLPKAPKFKGSLGAELRFDVPAGGALRVRADYTWQDEIFFSAFQSREPLPGAPALAVMRQKAFGWLKGRVSYDDANGRWNLAAYIDNATDERVATNQIFTGDIVGARVAGNLAPPRTYGVELGYRF
jgi:iron complex outermembrane receptor protein